MYCLHDGTALTAEMAAWVIAQDADGFWHGQPYSCHTCGRFFSVGTHDDGRIRVTDVRYEEPIPIPPSGSFAKMDERVESAKQEER